MRPVKCERDSRWAIEPRRARKTKGKKSDTEKNREKKMVKWSSRGLSFFEAVTSQE